MASRARVRLQGICPLLILSQLCGACGYQLGYRVPPDVYTIAVPIFENSTFPARREIEFELTALVRKEFQHRSPLRLVESDQADLVLRGRIVEFKEYLVAEGRQDRKEESSLTAVVDLILEDRRNQTTTPHRVTAQEPFSVELGESFRSGQQRALANLAERIVSQVEYWEEEEVSEKGDDG
jgi:hypothetical protein